MTKSKIKIGLVDDHTIVRAGVSLLLSEQGTFDVMLQASNGIQLLDELTKLTENELPDIILMDINFGSQNGIQTTKLVSNQFPTIKVIGFSMFTDEQTMVDMIKAGARGFMVKSSEPATIIETIKNVMKLGFYYDVQLVGSLARALQEDKGQTSIWDSLSDVEKQFVEISCSDYTYREIAAKLSLSERTIDKIREKIFDKVGVKSRVGMAIEAVRRGWVHINEGDA